MLLDPRSEKSLAELTLKNDKIGLLIGAEGGLTQQEISHAKAQNFQSIQLGPRILRTETAALAALSVIQYKWGGGISILPKTQ